MFENNALTDSTLPLLDIMYQAQREEEDIHTAHETTETLYQLVYLPLPQCPQLSLIPSAFIHLAFSV